MKKLFIILGPSGSGKTTFAKKYATENNGEYIDFDLIFDYKDKDFRKFINELKALIERSKKELLVIDGYVMHYSPSLESLEQELSAKIHPVICFAAPHVIRERQNKKVKNLHISELDDEITIRDTIYNLHSLLSTKKTDSIFVDSTNRTNLVPKEEFYQRWQELIFLSALEKMNHDRYYQDILLPSGIKISGYSNSEETWKRLSSIVDFKNKSVIDYGPFHGFMSFKIEEAGASRVIGVEKTEEALNTARYIGWLKKSRVVFLKGDIQTFKPDNNMDIGLVLNMLHHVPDQNKALLNVFSSVETAIFEINFDQEQNIKSVALDCGFKIQLEINSERASRKILVFQSNKTNVKLNENGENKFKFNSRQYKLQKAIKHLKSILRSLRVLGFTKYIIKKFKKL